MIEEEARVHWADNIAKRFRHKQQVVCAAGISPSGAVHIGNFREIITVDFVVRAIRDGGGDAQFLYFWDDYDALRRAPLDNSFWREHLRKPLAHVPDPNGSAESYGRINERAVEDILPALGIAPTYRYQCVEYERGAYARLIQRALEQRDAIRDILNAHRREPLPCDWWPITIYSAWTGRDTTEVIDWDGAWVVRYRCAESAREESVDIRNGGGVKLKWRIDWPMRWAYAATDFEPAGKDHHSDGGSFTTARQICERIFNRPAPQTVSYDFIGIKGGGGKLSSSGGDSVGVADVLSIYQPQVMRYLFASTRPNAEFAISFDGDVIKLYEDYDRCERIVYGMEEVGAKRLAKERRIYMLSQPHAMEQLPDNDGHAAIPQISFRHICALMQIYEGDSERALNAHSEYRRMSVSRKQVYQQRALCAWQWVRQHAPDIFRYTLADANETIPVNGQGQQALRMVYDILEHIPDDMPDTAINDRQSPATMLHARLHAIARHAGLEFGQLCALLYQIFIRRDDGPRLANFMLLIGAARCREYLRMYT